MRTCIRALIVVLIAPLTSWAQGVGGSISTSYNNVTVSGTVDAGWSNDVDPNCGFTSEYPYLPYYLNGLTSSGAVASNVSFTQVSYAGECQGSPDNVYDYQLSYADLVPGNRSITIDASLADGVSNFTPDPTQTFYYSVPGAIGQPIYKIVSVVYDPPGNLSTNGFTASASTGTIESVGKTFTEGNTITFGGGILGQNKEWTFGASVQQGSSDAFQETHSQGFGSSIKSVRDPLNHLQDRIYLWLNPQVTFVQTGPSAANYSLATVNGQPMDILSCSVADFQNPSQMSPSCQCSPYTLDGTTVPGVCNICANPSSCTAADFAPIVAADPFISGGVSLVYQGCTSDSRFCYVGSNVVQGPDQNGDLVSNTFNVSDSNLRSQTYSQQLCTSVGYTNKNGLSIFGVFTLGVRNTTTFTWCGSESTNNSNGTMNQAQLNLESSGVGCTFGVDIYEDTVFHTFFPNPSGTLPSGCGQ